MIKIIKEWFIQNYGYQLIVPEFKARHCTMSYDKLVEWMKQYRGQDTKVIVVYPKRGFDYWEVGVV